ncbi:hypothetical protein LTR27_010463 [Elasticomyces elasticus]|nr:hypothetical protein LTR27_010463 [Elasticomyces elasticus]
MKTSGLDRREWVQKNTAENLPIDNALAAAAATDSIQGPPSPAVAVPIYPVRAVEAAIGAAPRKTKAEPRSKLQRKRRRGAKKDFIYRDEGYVRHDRTRFDRKELAREVIDLGPVDANAAAKRPERSSAGIRTTGAGFQ